MRATPVALVTTAILVATPSVAFAGSDSPTPYTVTASGVTLPTGQAFRDNGHVNYRATALDGTDSRSFNVHLESGNGRATAAYIGAGFIDFAGAAATFPTGYCVTWVQVEGFDEHFGEGGQAPACTPAPTMPVPTPLSPAPGKPLAPAPVPGSPQTTEPDVAAPVEAPTSEPVTGTPTTPTTRELAATGPAPETPAGAATAVTQAVRPATQAAVTASSDEGGLAATGSNALFIAVGAGALLAAGFGAVLFSRRGRRA